MNIQQASVADKTTGNILIARGSLRQRAAAVAATAAAEAEEVDRDACFPKAAIDAARQQELLGSQIPTEFGGYGASIFDVTDMCYALGRACASTAMIFRSEERRVGKECLE